MTRISVPGNDRGSLIPAALLLTFLMLCALCGLAAVTDRYARYARRLESSFRSGLEKENAEAVRR